MMPERRVQTEHLPAAHDLDFDFALRRRIGDGSEKFVGAADGAPIKARDDIVRLKACLRRR